MSGTKLRRGPGGKPVRIAGHAKPLKACCPCAPVTGCPTTLVTLVYTPPSVPRFFFGGLFPFVGGCAWIELLKTVPLVDLAAYWAANYGASSQARRYTITLSVTGAGGFAGDVSTMAGDVSLAGVMQAPDTFYQPVAYWPASLVTGCTTIGPCGPDYSTIGYTNWPLCTGGSRVAFPAWTNLKNVGANHPSRSRAYTSMSWVAPPFPGNNIRSVGVSVSVSNSLKPGGSPSTFSVTVTDSDYMVWGIPGGTNTVTLRIYCV